MVEEEVSSDAETSENSSSDEPEAQVNVASEYEKLRKLRIEQNKARMEAMGLRKIADSLKNLSQKKGKGIKSKKGVKYGNDDDEYEPNDDEDDPKDGSCSSDSSDEYEEEVKRKKKKKHKTTVRNRKLRSDKENSLQKQHDIADVMDEDEALKQAIALSLKDIGETSDLQHGSPSTTDQAANANKERRKRRMFKSRVQMTEDDLVINFCQFDALLPHFEVKSHFNLDNLLRVLP